MFLTTLKFEFGDGSILRIESQSPQIGSMFLTVMDGTVQLAVEMKVAIPSNRVNVSYFDKK